jgi:hypothetical protein
VPAWPSALAPVVRRRSRSRTPYERQGRLCRRGDEGLGFDQQGTQRSIATDEILTAVVAQPGSSSTAPSGVIGASRLRSMLRRAGPQPFRVRIEGEADVSGIVHGLHRGGMEQGGLLIEHPGALGQGDAPEIRQRRDQTPSDLW